MRAGRRGNVTGSQGGSRQVTKNSGAGDQNRVIPAQPLDSSGFLTILDPRGVGTIITPMLQVKESEVQKRLRCAQQHRW